MDEKLLYRIPEVAKHLSRIRIGKAIDGMDANRGLVHAAVVDNLTPEGWHLVDRQTWPTVTLALFLDCLRPLLALTREAQVLLAGIAVFALRLLAEFEHFAAFNELAIFGHSTHPRSGPDMLAAVFLLLHWLFISHAHEAKGISVMT